MKTLLHVCCAPCAGGCVERLLAEGREILLYFANPNLVDKREFNLRLDSVKLLADIYHLPLEVEPYDHSIFLAATAGLANEPEGGRRCFKCFELNLGLAARKTSELGFDSFCTSLTVSPRKNSTLIGEAGKQYPNFEFYDFKPGDTYRRSCQIARNHNFYRQRFCGCEFSR